jgi:acyl-CoA synthetase (AMP-forming)/AMP-acid ligase II
MERPGISTGPALMIPAGYPRDLPSALLRAAHDFPSAGVVEVGPDGRATRLDFPTLLELAARILAGLRASGVRPGDPAVVHCTEPIGFLAAFWACTLGGIRPLLMAPSAEGDTTEEGRQRLRKVTELLGWSVLIGRPSDLPSDLGLPVLDPDALAGHEPATEFHRPAADDVAVLMMSSGTTGTPKLIQLTHRGLVEFAAGTPAMLPIRPGQTTLNWLPLDQSGAFLLYHLLPVFTGCTNIHVATDLVLREPLRWFDLMEQYRVNHSWSPNFGYRLVTTEVGNEPDRHWDLSALRSLVSGGEQITVPVMSEFLRITNRFGVVPETFVPAWGMTETVTGITFARPGLAPNVHRVRIRPTGAVEWVDQRSAGKVTVARPGKSRADAPDVLSLVSVGAPAPGATVRIVGANGVVLPEGRIGQLQVASARVTPGYLGNPEADRAAFPAGNWPARKWLATGDQAFITGGQVVITGRESERLVLRGVNYYAHDVEAVAATAEGILPGLVAACGVADPVAGTDRLVVFYALAADPVDGVDEAIRTAVFDRLGLTAQVVGVPLQHFPRTPGGKILRPVLKQRWLGGTLEIRDGVPAAPVNGKPSPGGSAPSAGSPYGDPTAGSVLRYDAIAREGGYDERGEETTELPVIRLARGKTAKNSIPTPPERPTLGARDEPNRAEPDEASRVVPVGATPVGPDPIVVNETQPGVGEAGIAEAGIRETDAAAQSEGTATTSPDAEPDAEGDGAAGARVGDESSAEPAASADASVGIADASVAQEESADEGAAALEDDRDGSTEVESEPTTHTRPAPDAHPAPDARPAPDAEPASDAEPDSNAEPRTDAELDIAAEPDTEAQADSGLEVDLEPRPETDLERSPEDEERSGAEAGPGAATEHGPVTEAGSAREPGSAIEPGPATEPGAATEPGPATEPVSATDPGAETQPDDATEPGPETVAGAATEPGP